MQKFKYKAKDYNLNESYELFVLDCKARGLTDESIRFYEIKLKPFLRNCDENAVTLLSSVESVHIKKYLVSLQEKKFSGHHVHGVARSIRAFFNYCIRDGLLETSPFVALQMPKLPKKVLPAFTSADLKSIFRACKMVRDELICLFLLDTGVRGSELLALNVGDVKGSEVTVIQGKGQKDRTVYIGNKVKRLLRAYMIERDNPRPEAPLFVSERRDERLHTHGLVRLMQRIQEKSGIENCTSHAFRRTFAINALRNGMNIYALAKLMGHEDITVLRQYLELVEADLADAHKRFGVVDNLK